MGTSPIQYCDAHWLFAMVRATPARASPIMITMATTGAFQARAAAYWERKSLPAEAGGGGAAGSGAAGASDGLLMGHTLAVYSHVHTRMTRAMSTQPTTTNQAG